MKAILLAAGFGSRLRPITDTIPKCLVPINGKPLLQIWLETLSQAGITEFLINTHYLSSQVISFVKGSDFKDVVTLFHEEELLGTLGTLRSTEFFWEQEEVLVVHADNLCLCSWSCFIDFFRLRPNNCIATLMLFDTDTPSSCGIVELDEEKRVVAFHEKVPHPPSNLASGAIYLFDRRLKDLVSSMSKDKNDISLHLMPLLLGKAQGWKTDGYLRDIGTLESLQKANRLFENRLV